MWKIINKKYYIGFLIFCLVVSFLLNINFNCSSNDDYDIDPLRGGSNGCDFSMRDFSFLKLSFNTIGLYIFGFLSYEIIKKQEIKIEMDK